MVKKKKDKRQRIPLWKYTKGGRISTVMAVLSVAVFVVAAGISIAERGEAGIIVGVLAFATFLISLAGFIVGIQSFKEETRFYIFMDWNNIQSGGMVNDVNIFNI